MMRQARPVAVPEPAHVFGHHRSDQGEAAGRLHAAQEIGQRGGQLAAATGPASALRRAGGRGRSDCGRPSASPSVVFERIGKNATIQARMSSATLIRSKPTQIMIKRRNRHDRRHLQHDGIGIEHHFDDAALREQHRECNAADTAASAKASDRDPQRRPQRRHQRGEVPQSARSRSPTARAARMAGSRRCAPGPPSRPSTTSPSASGSTYFRERVMRPAFIPSRKAALTRLAFAANSGVKR